MKSKIEKEIFNLMNTYAIASNLPGGDPNETRLKSSEMAVCVNKLIDLFNSQTQLLEIEEATGEIADIVEKTKSYLNSQDQEEEDFWKTIKKGEEIYNDFTGEKSNIEIPQDTPEEWEKEFENPEGQTYDDPTRIPAEYHKLWESHGVDGYEVLETYPESAFELDPEKVVTFIKQLLEEKEREAKKELLEQLVIVVKNGTPEEFQRVLDNLNNKKK